MILGSFISSHDFLSSPEFSPLNYPLKPGDCYTMHNTHCPTQERCASGRSHIPVRPKNHTHVRVAAQTLKGSMPRNLKRKYEQQRSKQQSKLVWRCLRSICTITTIPFWAFFKHLKQVQVWGGRWVSSFFGAGGCLPHRRSSEKGRL